MAAPAALSANMRPVLLPAMQSWRPGRRRVDLDLRPSMARPTHSPANHPFAATALSVPWGAEGSKYELAVAAFHPSEVGRRRQPDPLLVPCLGLSLEVRA